MRIWERWPWTNIHDLNLDWILCNLRKMWDKIHEITVKITEMEPKLLPPGGTNGQVLAKRSTTDYDCEWVDQSGGGGSGRYVSEGGTDGQVLTSDGDNGYAWENLPQVSEVPGTEGADTGDVLTVNALGGYGWEAPPSGGLDATGANQGQVPTADGQGAWQWADQEGGVDASQATAGQVLTADGQGGFGFQTPPSTRQVPNGGTNGDVLRNTGNDTYGWGAIVEVPATTGSNTGDVLTVDQNGDPAWVTPAGSGSGAAVGLGKLYGYSMPYVSAGSSVPISQTLLSEMLGEQTFGVIECFMQYRDTGSANRRFIPVVTKFYVAFGAQMSWDVYVIDSTDNSVIKVGRLSTSFGGDWSFTYDAARAPYAGNSDTLYLKWVCSNDNRKIIQVPTPV